MNHEQTTPAKLLKLLADDTRQNIIRLLSLEDSYVELLAARLALTPATVCYHLKKLESAGVVRCSRSQFYIIYALNREVLEQTLGQLILSSVPAPDPDRMYEQEVISRFFRYGRLIRLPAQQKKQTIVLREIARRFTPDTDYGEREVNAILSTIFDDACTLRRALIAEGIMTRRAVRGQEDVYRLI